MRKLYTQHTAELGDAILDFSAGPLPYHTMQAKALPTVAKGFMESMLDLSKVLDRTACSFIRSVQTSTHSSI